MKASPSNRFLYNPKLAYRARELRNSMTMAECILWRDFLSKRRFGEVFKRQRPIGPYIVDFVCLPLLLIIEVDGESHQVERIIQYDSIREQYLKYAGFHVIRIKYEEVFNYSSGMDAFIRAEIERRREYLK